MNFNDLLIAYEIIQGCLKSYEAGAFDEDETTQNYPKHIHAALNEIHEKLYEVADMLSFLEISLIEKGKLNND